MPPPHPHVHTPLATAAPPAAHSSMSSAPKPIDRHMVWLVAGAFFALTLCAAGLACWWKWGCNRKRRVRPEEDASAHRQHRRLVLALEKQAREHAARYQPDAPPIPRPTLALAAATAALAQSCSTGALQCCDTVEKASDPSTAAILASIGVVVQDVDALVGLTCSPIAVIGVGSGNDW